MRNVKCSYCDEYRNEWCEKVTDSPHPDILRDCQYFHEAKTRWILCSVRMPDPDTWVLVSCDEDVTIMAVTEYGEWYFMDGDFTHGKIDAWMPLPEPYKGVKE